MSREPGVATASRDRKETPHSQPRPAESRIARGGGARDGCGGRGKERGKPEQARKQPNLECALRMENGRDADCSRAWREVVGAGRRARVPGLCGVAGE